jgi:hypothetical protein
VVVPEPPEFEEGLGVVPEEPDGEGEEEPPPVTLNVAVAAPPTEFEAVTSYSPAATFGTLNVVSITLAKLYPCVVATVMPLSTIVTGAPLSNPVP